MKLYLDLDGVLADFDKRKLDTFGTLDVPDEIMWHVYNEFIPDFFVWLDFKPDAYVLFDFCKQYNPTILTALPKKNSQKADMQKRFWVKKMFGDVPVITCFREEEKNYSVPGAILVDDNKGSIREWNGWGEWNIPRGFGILHNNAEETISVLKKVLQGL